MPISITFTAESTAELHKAIAEFIGATPSKAESKPAAAKPAPKAETAPTPAPEPEAESAGEVTDADLKTAAVSYQQKNGRDALAAALKEHGAPAGVTSIPAERRADFVAFCSAE